jgi:hypothetical protein
MNIGPYLFERAITKFSTNVTLTVDISVDASKHADDRKFRHDKEITDAEIRGTIFKATEQIIQASLDGSLGVEDKFLIFDRASENLNIVGKFSMSDSGPEKITVITVMREPSFHANDIKKVFKV